MCFIPQIRFAAGLTLFLLVAANSCLIAQTSESLDSSDHFVSSVNHATGSISGTVLDINGAIVPGATIVLDGAAGASRTVLSDGGGTFVLQNVAPAGAYRVLIRANGFAEWKSEPFSITAGQSFELSNISLKAIGDAASVIVTASSAEIAAEQVRIEEKQRVLGLIPNYLVVYDRDPAPLTPKMKFMLAVKVSVDPVTFVGVATLSAANQAADRPNYQQGLRGYGQRFGSLYADGFTDLMIGGALLPIALHQDPRFFYQGGATRSRIIHAIMSPFVCRSDYGRRQPNFSSIGGDLISTAIAETYYPESNRGAGAFAGTFLVNTGERMISAIAQEFILRKLTPNAKNPN
jgi:Carboxypeptidase regulatory-like domain